MTHIVQFPERPRPNLRTDLRQRCLIGAVAVAGAGAPARDGVLRNLSSGGAQLDLDWDGEVPSEFFLINLKHRLACRATPAWRNRNKTGLRIDSPHFLDAPLPSDMAFLSALFVQAKLRQVDLLLDKGFSLAGSLARAEVPAGDYQGWRQAGAAS